MCLCDCSIGEVLNQYRSVARQYSYFFRLFQVLSLLTGQRLVSFWDLLFQFPRINIHRSPKYDTLFIIEMGVIFWTKVYCQLFFIIFGTCRCKKFATGGCVISPPNMVYVTALPCKILIATSFMSGYCMLAILLS